MEGSSPQWCFPSATHEHLDHPRILPKSIDLLNRLNWILLGDENRALITIERPNPGVQRPVVDSASNRRRQVHARLNSEAQEAAGQDCEVDAARVEIVLFNPSRVAGRMRLRIG